MPRVLPRRNFLRNVGKAGAGLALASIPLTQACKGKGVITPEPPPSPVPVNLQFKIYNHTQGLRGSFSKTGVQSGTVLSLGPAILASDHGIGDVDTTRIVVREENFGKLALYKRTDFASLTVPRVDTNYDIFLFNNAGAKWLYDWQDDLSARWHPDGPWAMMLSQFPLRFYRRDLDGQTGEERVWGGELLPETGGYGVFDQMNDALKPGWAPFRYGYFDRGGGSDLSYGFGLGYGHEYWKDYGWVVVNPNLLTTVPQQVAGGVAAVIERLIGWEDVGGAATYIPIQSNGVLNQVGKDYLAFLFVRDPNTHNIT